MITSETIRRWAITQQTTELNIAREYVQHLFLAELYRQRGSQQLLFKGGTALRLAYHSPRFSEDLDFSGFGVRLGDIEEWVVQVCSALEQLGLGLTIEESKKTSGGYLGILAVTVSGYRAQILIEVSQRRKSGVSGQGMLISSDFAPTYTAVLLPQELLVEEKLEALLTRAKPRDFFDCYFMLRQKMITPTHKTQLEAIRETVAKTRLNFKSELSDFLPRSHHPTIADFKAVLLAELDRW
ncbi:MAG: nucleotidyl transferase AbiEii/AbiGii toxin family protein [Chloroflexi bacterium]|nr:nucleotidyl transferase AbiEii/AbiGii toxin family protein [Chloroflexota bacterium]